MLYSRCVILAAALALLAAVLHASWNIVVKQTSDRFLALWAQFVFAGSFALIALVGWTIIDGQPNIAWWWSIFSGCGHLPYVILLAKAYDKSDFSLTYPIARGAGALSAAILGLIFLGDDLSALSMAGIAVVIFGLWVLVSGQPINNIFPALGVAATIGVYSVVDAYGARNSSPIAFALSVFVSCATTITIWALLTRRKQLKKFLATEWKPALFGGTMSIIAYSLVIYAFTLAPVGYVATMRESSVVIAALAGWKYLKEDDHKRRLTSASVVVLGLIVLVAGR
ncbi:MAG: DMT family transporter [Actinomycetota bacterium]|nr:DMT family transporter [Actinomycetota bacterium]